MSFTVPKTCRAAVTRDRGDNYYVECVEDYPVPVPQKGQLLLRLNLTGLCLSDHHFMKGDWGVDMEAHVDCAGHEGAGVVVALGEDVDPTVWKIGDRAGLKPVWDVCGACELCRDGDETICKYSPQCGGSVQGSYCEYVLSPAKYTARIPDGVSDEMAGPLMCSGATTYAALKRTNTRPGQWVAIPGGGGGVGSMAVQYARCLGLRVVVIDTSEEKRKQSEKLGAEAFIDFADFKTQDEIFAEVHRITGDGAHAVVVTGGSGAAYKNAHRMLRRRGTLVCVGLPPAGTAFVGGDPIEICVNKYNIRGSLVGSLDEIADALDFAKRGLITVDNIKLYDFHKFPELAKKLAASQIPGRAVVRFR